MVNVGKYTIHGSNGYWFGTWGFPIVSLCVLALYLDHWMMYWSRLSFSSLDDWNRIFSSWNKFGENHEVSSSDWCEDLFDCRKHLRQLNKIIGAAGLLGCCCWSWRSHFLSIHFKWEWSLNGLCVSVLFAFVVETVIKRLVDCLRSVCLQCMFCCFFRYRILFNDCAPMIVPLFFFRESLFWFHVESNDLFQQIKLFLCLIVSFGLI